MKLRAWMFIIVTLLMAGRLSAQEATPDAEYRLRVPTAEEYLDNVDAVVANAETIYSYWNDTGGTAELDALADEIQWRLIEQDQVTYQQLMAFYRAFASSSNAGSTSTDDSFIRFLVEQWLAENPTDLYVTPFLTIGDFVFDVHPLGRTGAFSLTGRIASFDNMALYHVGFSGEAANFIVMRDDSGEYWLPPLPAPMFGDVIEAGDFNADRQSDFAYLNYIHVGNNYVSGSLSVVTWTGEAFETLSSVHFNHGPAEFDPALTWQFRQYDEDDEEELLQTQRLYDNWGCDFIRVTYYDWQEDGTLGFEASQDNLPENFSCSVRSAEQNMWQHRYDEAIELYEEALNQSDQSGYFALYAQMRLGLAYLLTEQADKAGAIFTGPSVPLNDDRDYEWVETVREAYQRDPRLLPICQSIYDQALNIYSFDTITGTVYVTDGGFYGPGWYDPGIDLENLSCDLAALIRSELASMTFSTESTPVDQLESLGLEIGDSISADLDTDSDGDWLVWIASLGIDPILFIADGTEYTQSVLEGLGSGDYLFPSADLKLPDEFNQYKIIHFPDGSLALENVDFGTDRYSDILCAGRCGGGPSYYCAENDYAPDPARRMGDLTLWRLEGGQLTPFFFASLCGWGFQSNLFPDGEGGNTLLAGDEFLAGEMDVEIRPVIYEWDENARTYVAPPQPSCVPMTPTPVPTQILVEEPRYPLYLPTYFQVRTAFAQVDFALALEILTTALSQPEPRDPSLVEAFHYYRALTLEAVNRPDEAQTEYVAIYEAAPESAWGMLAALHLERGE